jgi:hypothetical protein
LRVQEIVFAQGGNQIYHAFRHTDALGLSRTEVVEAIRRDIERHLPFPVPTPRNFLFVARVTVAGRELQYRAHPISDGVVNVGRITAA